MSEKRTLPHNNGQEAVHLTHNEISNRDADMCSVPDFFAAEIGFSISSTQYKETKT